MGTLIEQFIKGIKGSHPLEFVAVVFGIASVLYSRKENILVYPTGIISTLIYIWLCGFLWGLYAEASLNIYYTVMSIYGWYNWSKSSNSKPLSISKNTVNQNVFYYFLCIIFWIILYFVLKKYTNSNVPLADSFAAASACVGMILMAKKKIENWHWWIITNLVSVPLYFYKGAVFTAVQFIVFLILAIAGLISWQKKLNAIKH